MGIKIAVFSCVQWWRASWYEHVAPNGAQPSHPGGAETHPYRRSCRSALGLGFLHALLVCGHQRAPFGLLEIVQYRFQIGNGRKQTRVRPARADGELRCFVRVQRGLCCAN